MCHIWDFFGTNARPIRRGSSPTAFQQFRNVLTVARGAADHASFCCCKLITQGNAVKGDPGLAVS
jgi:hypothetical protein